MSPNARVLVTCPTRFAARLSRCYEKSVSSLPPCSLSLSLSLSFRGTSTCTPRHESRAKTGLDRAVHPAVEVIVWNFLIGPWWLVRFQADFLAAVPRAGCLRKIKIIISPENSMTVEEFAATPSRNYILLLGTIGIIMTRVLRHYN